MSKEDKSKIDKISISTLEISNLLATGKKIATISVGSTPYNILAPATYAWSEITSKPTTLAGYGITNAVLKQDYINLNDLATTHAQIMGYGNPDGGWKTYSSGILSKVHDTGFALQGLTNSLFFRGISGSVWEDNWHEVLHSGNYATTLDNAYLKLSGGTMKGVITMPINHQVQWGDSSYMIYGGNNYVQIFAPTGLMVNSNVVLHAGNFNNYAPTLTGVGASGTWGINARGIVSADTRPATANTTYGDGVLRYYLASSAMTEGKPFGDASIIHMAWDNMYQDQGYDAQIAVGRENINSLPWMQIRRKYYADWGDWRTVAFTDSNVASATKLATARTIWGQSFDGTANVAGNMSGVGTINGICNITTAASGAAILNIIETNADINYIHLYVSSANTTAAKSRPLVLQNDYGNVGIGIIAPTQKLEVNGNVKATSFIGNLDGTYVNKLTGYTKATAISALASTDTLNTALGKLEYKADVAYNLVRGAYDGDGTIENLEEILRVLDGIKDTETIKAIVGKYLPLTGGVIKNGAVRNPLTIDTASEMGAYINFAANGTIGAYVGYNSSVGAFMEESGTALKLKNGVVTLGNYIVLHSGNYNSYAPKLDGTGATGTWNIDISGDANTLDGVDLKDLSRYIFKRNITYGLNDGDDLNNLTYDKNALGYYTTGDNKNYLNSPLQNFGLWVTSLNTGYTGQLMLPYGRSRLHYRSQVWSADGLIWTSWDPIAWVSDIPTKVSQLTNDSGFLTSTSLNNYVTLNTAQTISAKKTFSAGLAISGGATERVDLPYFLGIDAFDDGGSVRWLTASKVCAAIGALPTSGGTLTGSGNVLTLSNASGGDISLKFSRGGNTAWEIVNTAGNLLFNELHSNTTRLVLYENTQGGSAAFTGSISATSFIKSGSSNSYVLLGGGGHKAISDFVLASDFASKELSSNLITITKSITLTKDWQDTGIVLNETNFPTGSGTYAIQVFVADGNQNFWNSYFSGVMSIYIYATNAEVPDDEILLHHASHACAKQIYLKTKPTLGGSGYYNKLYIACNTNCSSAISIVFKFKKLI